MKKGRFSEEQMVGLLREADRSSVAEVARKHGISEQTLYNWRKHFAASSPRTSNGCVSSSRRTPG